MRYDVFDRLGEYLLRSGEGDPVCGTDLCDRCGDCLHCYSGDPCLESLDEIHWWVKYEDE